MVEDGKLFFWRLRVPERQFNKEFKGFCDSPECWRCEIPLKGLPPSHVNIINNWVEAIVKGSPLIAPGEEGINSLEISNAAYLSSWTKERVSIPVDEDRFYALLKEKFKK